MKKNYSDEIIRKMFGVRLIVTLFVTIELYQCMASPSNQSEGILQSSSILAESRVANRGEFTYSASLRTYWTHHYCASAIVSDRWLLTSATCVQYSFFEINEVFAVLGGLDIYEGDSYRCDLVMKHELFELGQFEYDVALIRTTSTILFGQLIQPIPYYKGSIGSDISNAVSIGWGQDWNDGSMVQPLTCTSVTVLSKTECPSTWQDEYKPSLCPSTALCGNYPTSRDFEFGVPLATSDSRVLIGIYAGSSRDGFNRPDLYTGTADVANWIFQNSLVDGVNSL